MCERGWISAGRTGCELGDFSMKMGLGMLEIGMHETDGFSTERTWRSLGAVYRFLEAWKCERGGGTRVDEVYKASVAHEVLVRVRVLVEIE